MRQTIRVSGTGALLWGRLVSRGDERLGTVLGMRYIKAEALWA